MKVKQLMERVGINETGRALAYIKDGMEELNILFETHTTEVKSDVTQDQRFYDFPNEMIKVLDIRCKNHLNSKDEYRSIPRLIYKPKITDADNT